MSNSIISLTLFEVRKLRCMGGEGRANPYRITTYRGIDLGTFGSQPDHTALAANNGEFEPKTAKSNLVGLRRAIRRISR